MLKLNHGADLHYRRERAADVFASLDVIDANSDDADLTILAGDLYDSPVQNTGASQFPEYLTRIARIAKKAPIVMVQGSPGHDSDGSLDVFEQISDRITVLKMGKAYFLGKGNDFCGIREYDAKDPDFDYQRFSSALILGMPEPQKKHLLAADSDITLDQAVRAILLGYAAIRAKYHDLPCILVYHGQVRGARMANGEPCEGGVSIDDLALVGADYIAMGDIHKPQRIGETRGLNAYYAGAAHPTKDWNEAGIEFGFNRVEIADEVTVSRIPFPHPMLIKIENAVRNTENLSFEKVFDEIKGKRVWLELSCTKEQSFAFDTEGYLHDLLSFGADPRSRVTLKILSSETVRSGEITKLRTLRAKFDLWSRNSSRVPTDAQMEKADIIELEASGKGLSLNGGSFSFDKLILRGAKGVWKKQRKDEITLDLTQFDPGIVGLIGPNGRGKTTIMNNFHVWSEMPNMGGPLHKQFRLKDSFREVYATEHNSGTQYRSRILMDPTLKAPTARYYLDSRQEGTEEWTSVPGIDGRVDTYADTVNRIFGTMEMYIRTALMMQFPTADYPDLSKATKGAKKQIMSALAGLDFYEIYKGIAEARRKDHEARIGDLTAKLSVMTETLGDHDELESAVLMAESETRKLRDALPAMEASGKAIAAEVEILRKRAADQQVIQDQIIDITNRIPRELVSESSIKKQISELGDTIKHRPNADETVKRYDDLKAVETKLIEEKTRILESNAVANEAYRKVKEKYDQDVRAIERERDETDRKSREESASMSKEMALLRQDWARMKGEYDKPITNHCDKCRQLLPADALSHIQKERDELKRKMDDNDLQADPLKSKIENLEADRKLSADGFAKRLNAIAPPENPEDTLKKFDEAPLREIQETIRTIDITAARRVIEGSVSAQARIEELEKKLIEISARLKENHDAVEALKVQIDPELGFELDAKKQDLETARKDYQDTNAALAKAKADAEHAAKAFSEYEANVEKIESMRAEVDTLQVELADWKALEQACGQNGIQALELDAVCPTIAGVASTLLREYEDGRYSIRFDTTREGGKGNQIEDFLIQVIDSKDGEEQEFETLSGGEAVWIRKALQDAFGIIRGQNSGTRYLTGFLDESDSALFPEARIAYFRMLESAHTQSVRRHTVMVTHSTEIQEMIQQKIDVTKLDPVVREEKAA